MSLELTTPEPHAFWPCEFLYDIEDATGVLCELGSILCRVYYLPTAAFDRANKTIIPVLDDVKNGKLTYDEAEELLDYKKLFTAEELAECDSNMAKYGSMIKSAAGKNTGNN